MSVFVNRNDTDEHELLLSAKSAKGLFPVYRLEEDVVLLKEGAVRISFLVLRACSYKTKTEALQQGKAPYSSRG